MSDPTSGVSTEVTRDIELSRQLVEWYWQHGSRRGDRPADTENWAGNYEQFVLPTGTWLRQLYDVRDGLATVQAAARVTRPAVALWGMSQTGKSTSVSKLIDANVDQVPVPANALEVSDEQRARDGAGGGLHWTGGLPYFFVAPFRDTERGEKYPPHWYERSLNPFNSGLDASSCLSRFVPGSLTPTPGFTHVSDPKHPVEVHLVPPGDLLHALARGFDSECLGSALRGKHEEWTPDRFDRALVDFRDKHRAAAGNLPHRGAYEQMLAVVTTLNDLVLARVETFVKLRTTEADWHSRLESLLADNILIGDPKIADEFAGLIFWNSSRIFTERYNAMRKLYNELVAAWTGRRVFASLPVTSLLLDMQSCVNAYSPPADVKLREGKQQALIAALGYKIEGNRVVLGSGDGYPHRLGASAEQFANFQGLVWELVIPINAGNLRPGAFRDLLEKSDLLDFPGVGRDEKNESKRLNANPDLYDVRNDKQTCTPQRFYSDIVKRGKTASIVATYSRRLSVDSFTILQNLDSDEPSNHAVDQITNGVRTWLRNMVPGFTEGAGNRPTGVFLNLGLTFWGKFVEEADPERRENFGMSRKKYYDKLGLISDPDASTIFALNYHWLKISRVKFTKPFKRGEALYDRMVAEPEFQRLFKNPISVRSLEEMTDDLERGGSGGADFLYDQLRRQVETLAADTRSTRFAPIIERLESTFQSLLAWRHLRQPRTEDDTRRDELDAFVKRLHAAIDHKGETEVRLASYALRELLNVDPDSIALPSTGRTGLTSTFIEKLFNEWRNRQLQRYDEWARNAAPGGPEWGRLGVRDRDDVSRFLEALITSFERKTFTDIALLGQRAYDTIPGRTEHRQQHLRRYLAIEMTNRLLYKVPGRKPGQAAQRFRSDTRREAEPKGTATPAYTSFIGPFVGVQIAGIKQHLTPVVLRPPLHGDAPLEKLLGGSN